MSAIFKKLVPLSLMVALLAVAVPALAAQGDIATVAGTGVQGYSGDGQAALAAELDYPAAMALDADGNVYFVDDNNHRIRRVTPSGLITTIAGNGLRGFAGDGGPATSAEFDAPSALAFDAAGNLYVADSNNSRVRKIDAVTGFVSTVAGNGTAPTAPPPPDGVPATESYLSGPVGLAFDGAGNLYISELNGYRIRRVDSQGIISTVVGTGTRGYSGDGGFASQTPIGPSWGLAVDGGGNLFFAEWRGLENPRIRRVAPDGTISTLAILDRGDCPLDTECGYPINLATDTQDNVYVGGVLTNQVVRYDATGTKTVVAGTGVEGFFGDGGQATEAQLFSPIGVAVSSEGKIFISDSANQRIRAVGGKVQYTFAGFTAPVDNGVLNIAKAGSTIPLKFRVTDASGVPVSNLTASEVVVTSEDRTCNAGSLTDVIESYGKGSGLRNLGNGYYQSNWVTPKSYKGHCRTVTLSLGDGNQAHTADFRFK